MGDIVQDTGRDFAMEAVAYQHHQAAAAAPGTPSRSISMVHSNPAFYLNGASSALQSEDEEDDEEAEDEAAAAADGGSEAARIEEEVRREWKELPKRLPIGSGLVMDQELLNLSYSEMLRRHGLRVKSVEVANRGVDPSKVDADTKKRSMLKFTYCKTTADEGRRTMGYKRIKELPITVHHSPNNIVSFRSKKRFKDKRETLVCELCLCGVRGVSVACPSCGHGGHLSHLKTWFNSRLHCAAKGCECKCFQASAFGLSTRAQSSSNLSASSASAAAPKPAVSRVASSGLFSMSTSQA